MALHNYHDTYNTFPPGNTHSLSFPWGSSFQCSLLPYADQTPAYNRIDFSNQPGWGTNFPVYNGLKIPYMSCPSSPQPTQRVRDGVSLQISDYVGMSGVSAAATLAGRTSVVGARSDGAVNGVLSYNSRINFKDITDGSTNTILMGEQSDFGANRSDIRASFDWGAWMGCANCTDGPGGDTYTSGITTLHPNWPFGSKPDRQSNVLVGAGVEGPGNTPLQSVHTGGLHVLLCDGSIRFLSENIDRTIQYNLCDRRDGQVLGEF